MTTEATTGTTGTADEPGHELVDANEIASRLGLRNGRAVLDLRLHRLGFPVPATRAGRTLLWSWPHVEAWAVSGRTARGVLARQERTGPGPWHGGAAR
jgi:hypothetical protein